MKYLMLSRYFLCLFVASPAMAQVNGVSPPKFGSPQRAAIMNAIRPAVETELGPNVEFVPSCVQVWNGWALVAAMPQRRGGKPIESRYLSEWNEIGGIEVTAALRFAYGRWNLVGHAVGATDVWYEGVVPRALTSSRCY